MTSAERRFCGQGGFKNIGRDTGQSNPIELGAGMILTSKRASDGANGAAKGFWKRAGAIDTRMKRGVCARIGRS